MNYSHRGKGDFVFAVGAKAVKSGLEAEALPLLEQARDRHPGDSRLWQVVGLAQVSDGFVREDARQSWVNDDQVVAGLRLRGAEKARALPADADRLLLVEYPGPWELDLRPGAFAIDVGEAARDLVRRFLNNG